MENNQNEGQLTQAENMGNQEEQGKDEKLFTQEEVNGFVQSRIARLKGQIEKDSKAEYTQKLAELQAREMKLTIKEQLDARKMPRELADIITCTDEEELKNKLDALERIYGKSADKNKESQGFIQVGVTGSSGPTTGDPIRRAMGL